MYRKKEALPVLSQRLRLLRKLNDLTQQELADILHVERCTYAFYETGKSRPDLGLLLRIARIYKIKVDALIDPDVELTTIGVREPGSLPTVKPTDPSVDREKNEKQFAAMFRQMNRQQQEQVLTEMTRMILPSEANR